MITGQSGISGSNSGKIDVAELDVDSECVSDVIDVSVIGVVDTVDVDVVDVVSLLVCAAERIAASKMC